MRLKPYLLTGDVARAMGVSNQRVHQLDGLLQPERGLHGRRQYDPDRVAEVLTKRAEAGK